MSAGPVVDRVYASLRGRLLSGHYRPGQRLEVSELCDQLASSTTPVRDALNRLLGEGLVETPGREGFAAPGFDEPSLADLYRWSAELMRLALARGERAATAATIDGELPYPEKVAALLAAAASGSDNCEHGRAIAHASARLSPVRAVEPELLPDVESEFEELQHLLQGNMTARLRQALRRYHGRRIQRSSALVRLLYRPRP